MEKCIGCELCAGVCPAKCIYVRGADNPIDDPVSPGERYGFVYEINYLRCIHCDLCVEACPTEAITETQALRVLVHQPRRRDLHEGRARRRRRRPRQAHAVGALDRRRGRPHQRVDAGDRAGRCRRVRGPRELVGRARLRRPPPEQGQSADAGRATAFALVPPKTRRSPTSRDRITDGRGHLLRLCRRVARRRARCRARAQPGALGAVPLAHAGQRRGAVPPARGAARRRDPGGRVRERDRRAVPVRDHAARRRPA